MRSGAFFSRSRKNKETNDSADGLQEAPALFLIQNHTLNRKEKKAMMKQAVKIVALMTRMTPQNRTIS